jgi:hypothetical protein
MIRKVLVCSLVSAALGCTGSGKLKLEGKLSETSVSEGSSARSMPVGDGTLVIERARISVSELEFEGGDESDELESELGAAVIDLALDGTPTAVTAESVEAGDYHTFGMELRRGGPGDFAGTDPASIIVDGTYAGREFSYRSAIAPELEFPIAVNVPEGGEARAAVPFDVAAWFVGADGVVLDPADPAARSTIESRILDSLRRNATLEVEGEDDD